MGKYVTLHDNSHNTCEIDALNPVFIEKQDLKNVCVKSQLMEIMYHYITSNKYSLSAHYISDFMAGIEMFFL